MAGVPHGKDILGGDTSEIPNAADAEGVDLAGEPAAEVEGARDALVDDDGHRLPADLAQDTDLHTQVEPAFRAFDDPPVRVMLGQERPVEHFGQPQSEAHAVGSGIPEERQDGQFLHEREQRSGNSRPRAGVTARTGHVAHHVEEPFDGSEDEFFGNVPAQIPPMVLGNPHDDQPSGRVGSDRQSGELREDRRGQTTDAEMVGEIPQMVLPSPSEIRGVPVRRQRMDLLEVSYSLLEGIAFVSLGTSDSDDQAFNRFGTPFPGAVQGELAYEQGIDQTGDDATGRRDGIVGLVRRIQPGIPFDMVGQPFWRVLFRLVRKSMRGTGASGCGQEPSPVREHQIVTDDRHVFIIIIKPLCHAITSSTSLRIKPREKALLSTILAED